MELSECKILLSRGGCYTFWPVLQKLPSLRFVFTAFMTSFITDYWLFVCTVISFSGSCKSLSDKASWKDKRPYRTGLTNYNTSWRTRNKNNYQSCFVCWGIWSFTPEHRLSTQFEAMTKWHNETCTLQSTHTNTHTNTDTLIHLYRYRVYSEKSGLQAPIGGGILSHKRSSVSQHFLYDKVARIGA